MSDWVVGQRCASKGEPALGLGIVKHVGARRVQVIFPATGAERTYPAERAPLRRVAFEPGDVVRDNEGVSFVVQEVKEQNGVLFYLGDAEILPETELNHAIVFSKPHQKLLAGQVNKPWEFDLRHWTWQLKNMRIGSACHGFVGPRIELIPHQLYIAQEAASRRRPRVLLSDEVGLGKTIEAGLIFHRQWVTGEVKRALCLTPGQLVTQWLTELYRKFNVLFSIMTLDQAEELAKTHPDMNPYLAHQCVLQNIEPVLIEPELREAIVQVEWDLVIVDEAHHLFWSDEEFSPAYELVEDLSKVCGGMLLLTATPRQLGVESHFGRLKLLDPDRFDSLAHFLDESKLYSQLADLADRVLQGEVAGVKKEIAALFPNDHKLIDLAPTAKKKGQDRVDAFVRALVDRHGTGRIVFRNHRKVLSGYPKRIIHPIPLEPGQAYRIFLEKALPAIANMDLAQRLLAGAPAFQPGHLAGKLPENQKTLQRAWREDPRLAWLLAFLRERTNDKFLLICSRKSVALALQEWLGLAKDIDVAVFHEDLTLLERDRQAAYFAKPEGARLLICSEIGSEGRNFQFANQLILFDMPLNPALLEQRIGRLDRIGQRHDIHIYAPFAEGSPLEYLYRWYQEGLNAFEQHLEEGDYIFENLREKMSIIFESTRDPALIEGFIAESKAFATRLLETIHRGRDRLLELNSFDSKKAEALIAEIKSLEDHERLKDYMDQVFELFGVLVEDQDELATQIIRPSPQMFIESFPGLPDDGLEATYQREAAVIREELTFLSHDHPMVTGAMDLVLNLERGVTSFAVWKQAPEPGILLQCLHALECPGGDDARLARYLPPTPIMIAVDQNKRPRPDLLQRLEEVKLEQGPVSKLHKQRPALTEIVESLLPIVEEAAEEVAAGLRERAEQLAMNEQKEEYDRIKALMEINPGVRQEELEEIEENLNVVFNMLEDSKTRLDAVRLILMTP